LQVFNLYQAEIVPVPIASDAGLDALRSALAEGLRPKLLYVVPNFANPTGLTLSGDQRPVLLELAAHYGFVIVEDDPYGDLWLTERDQRPPALAAGSDQVIRLGSFSKVLFPAARIGHVTAPRPLADVLNKLKQAADLGNSHFVERIVHELVRRPGFLPTVLARSRAVYRVRRDTLIESLRTHVGERLSFARSDGGFFLWASLPTGADATRLLAEALALGVSFVPGAAFYAAAPEAATLRLSYSCAAMDQLTTAGPRLAAALDRLAR
jgi:2-aminoadipate transaminase